MCAAASRNANLVCFLLDNGADVTFCNNLQRTALHEAAAVANNVDVLRLLIERGADVNAKDRDGALPIERTRGVVNFRCLLEAGADPERALVVAAAVSGASKTNVDIVDELINRGVDVDARDSMDCTALMRSTIANATASILRLLAYNASVDAYTNGGKWTALGFSIEFGFDECCTQLLAAGADVNAACADGKAPLFVALCFAPYECVLLLLAAGADISAVDENGRLAIWSHVHPRRRDCHCLLVAAGATDSPLWFEEDEL